MFVRYNSDRVSGRFSVAFLHVVASSPMLTFKRALCWERTPTMGPACSLMFLLGMPRIQSPNRFTWEVSLGSVCIEQS